MLADIFTKSLPQESFFTLRFKLGVDNLPHTKFAGDVNTHSAHKPVMGLTAKPKPTQSVKITTTGQMQSSGTEST